MYLPNCIIGEDVTISLYLPFLFWTSFAKLFVELPRYCFGGESVWPLHIFIRVRIAQQYLRCYLNVHPTSFIQIEFLRFLQSLSVTGHAILIFLPDQDHIAQVLYSTGSTLA